MKTLTAALTLLLALVAVPASASADQPTTADRCCAQAYSSWISGDWIMCCYTEEGRGRITSRIEAYPLSSCQGRSPAAERQSLLPSTSRAERLLSAAPSKSGSDPGG